MDDINIRIDKRESIAEYLNKYFCEVGINLSNKICATPNNKLKVSLINENSIFLYPATKDEVKIIIDNLKDKAGGVDDIHARVLKNISENIAEPLTYIFNLCVELSVWPGALKKADIVPIFKANDKSKAKNYRPISLISNIAKIFEKLIY